MIYNPGLVPGGYAFEYFNSWYPDVDNTAVAVLAFIKHDPQSVNLSCVAQAVEWMLGMQNLDGGWGAYDKNNNKLFLNKIPFSDMNSLCDPSTADVTGRLLEILGLLLHGPCKEHITADLAKRMRAATEPAIAYIASVQESTGAWYGRWGVNYIYGTNNVQCGLAPFVKNDVRVQKMVGPAIQWVKSVQNADGGWGEGLDSYLDPRRAGRSVTTPSQTVWGLMALLAHLAATDDSIQRGISSLVRTQTSREGGGATWPQK